MSKPFSSADNSAAATPPAIKASWATASRIYLEPRCLRMLALGFSAGLPLILVLGTLSFWLREAGLDRATIGKLSWVGLVYAFKWVWAPLVDRVPIPLLTRALGRRRSWLLISQLIVMAALAGMALSDPRQALLHTIWFALAVAFASATQDIALDAFRIESAETQMQPALAAVYQTGYRIAMIWAGAGAFWLAARAELAGLAGYQHIAWQTAYLVMAASMLVGVLAVLLSPEPIAPDPTLEQNARGLLAHQMANQGISAPWPLALAIAGLGGLLVMMVAIVLGSVAWYGLGLAAGAAVLGFVGLDQRWGAAQPLRLRSIAPRVAPVLAWLHLAVYQPFAEFMGRYGRHAALVLGLIALYRISDVVMGIMANPFYVDMGYTKGEVAAVTKFYGVVMTLVGALGGGVLALRLGVMRVLMLGAVLSAASNLLFAWLATVGHDVTALVFVISADNLAGGMASAAFIGYLSSLTNINYTATQYALFSSMMLLLPKWLAGFSGTFVDAYGYSHFFIGTALLGVPVLALVWLASGVKTVESAVKTPADSS